ncbi:MAG TPA: rhomboid family intramembrane serine protease [Bacteroidales bacterium]|nr:rhomboid family intramembrane serine protease [Bacteroidales bacterium]HSA44436.1 rhomboid family intramembrane serine protease [Bacteroidales bacterium]
MSFQQHSPQHFRVLPPVVKNILIINVIFFLATLALGKSMNIDLVKILGLHYFGASAFEPYQIITYMFMHGGFTHILFNMFAVWMFGNALEHVWGGKRFLIYYLVTGVGAAICHYLIMYFVDLAPSLQTINQFLANPNPDSFNAFVNSSQDSIVPDKLRDYLKNFLSQYNQLISTDPDMALQNAVDFMVHYKREFLNAPVMIGASGAVFGILLAFGMLFPNSLIYIYFAFPIKAKWFVIIYGALELYAGITNEGSNVAHFAHLGGMVFGFFLIRLWHRKPKYFQ